MMYHYTQSRSGKHRNLEKASVSRNGVRSIEANQCALLGEGILLKTFYKRVWQH